MGCWNETCLVSNLSIRYNSPVVAFLIAHNSIQSDKGYSGSCYSTDEAFPISLPIEANYDDYGFIENFDEKSLAVKQITKLFGVPLIDMSESLHEGTLTIKGGIDNKALPVGLVMIDKHIYDTAINKISEIDRAKTKAAIISDLEFKLSFEKMDAQGKMNAFSSLDFSSRSGSVVQYGSDREFLNSVRDMTIVEIKKHPKKKDNILEKYSEALTDRVAIADAMRELRKTWLPPCGKGSQSDNFVSQIVLATAIKEAALADREPEELYMMFLGNRK